MPETMAPPPAKPVNAESDYRKKQVRELIWDTLEGVAAQTDSSFQQADVAKVAKPLNDEMDSVIENITNTELKWYQKRSRWAVVVAIVTPVLALALTRMGLEFGESEKDFVVSILVAFGNAIAAYFAYRAGVAIKPLGK